MESLDKFGFYEVSGRKTYSKLEAFEWANHDIDKVDWNFNRGIFSSYDWTKEPAQDINYFYDERAKQLREKYDYIVLMYSSGYDSHNILRTFIDNKIHIDEVLTIVPGLQISCEDSYEYLNYNKNKILKYSDELSRTKIRVIEQVDTFFDIIRGVSHDDIVYGMNQRFSVFHLVNRYIIKNLAPEYQRYGKKICFLYGIDKPIVVRSADRKKCSFYFSDNSTSNVVIETEKNPQFHTEFFYWDITCASMLIKQAHLLKKSIISSSHLFNFIPNKINQEKNTIIYPRCFADIHLGYSQNGTYGEYHTKVEKILGHPEDMMKQQIYRCMGSKNTWFYIANTDASTRIRNYLASVTKYPALFRNNNIYDEMKSHNNVYEI